MEPDWLVWARRIQALASVLHGWDTCRKGASLFFAAPDLAVMPHKYNAATIFRGRSGA